MFMNKIDLYYKYLQGLCSVISTELYSSSGLAIQKLFSSKVPTPNPSSEPTVPQAVAHAFEQFASYLTKPKPDLAKASELAEELTKVLKNQAEDVDLAKARVIITQLSKVCGATTTLETRFDKLEHTVKMVRTIGLGVATMFGAYLMTIPASVYMAKLDSNYEMSKFKDNNDKEVLALKKRIEVLESARPPSSIPTSKLDVDARVSHQFLDPPKKQGSEA